MPQRPKTKIGILACSNMTRVLDCPLGACLRDLHDRKGAFSVYSGEEPELVGTASCNGCPTNAAADTILSKVAGLLHYGATRIHLTYCMLVLCPFKKRYAELIRARYPDIDLVEGTHESHQKESQFRSTVEAKLRERWRTLIP